MKIIIAGLAKSGTTALFFKIKNSFIKEPVCFFEPKEDKKEFEQSDVLVKCLIDRFKDFALNPNIFESFDKKILIVRDPRDQIISSFLYNIRHFEIYKNDEKLENLVDLLKRKETDPDSVSLIELLKFIYTSEGKKFTESNFAEERRYFLQEGIDFNKKYKDYFLLKYEDFIDGKIEALEKYLGLELVGSATVTPEFKRVERTKKYGDWKNWFTAEDVIYFKKVFKEYMEEYGYEDQWGTNDKKKIIPEYCSLYVRSIVKQKIIEDATIKERKDFDEALGEKDSHINNLINLVAAKDSLIISKDSQLNQLADFLRSKDSQLNQLADFLRSKDSQLNQLADFLRSKDSQLNQLADFLRSKDSQLNQLADFLRSKDSQLNQLADSLRDKDLKISQFQENVAEKEKTIKEKESVLKETNVQISQLKEVVRNKDVKINFLEIASNDFKNIIKNMEKSLTWRFTRLIEKIVYFILPPRSFGRRFYDNLIIRLQVTKNSPKAADFVDTFVSFVKTTEKPKVRFKKILHQDLAGTKNSAAPHFFTICNLNYVPKARVLAESFKFWNPHLKFDLVLCDEPSNFNKGKIDNIINAKDIFLPAHWESWSFSHNITELCTAVKATSIRYFFSRGYEYVIYLDPDMEVFDNLNSIGENFNNSDILLIPHRSFPENDKLKIESNEFLFLQRGIFNLGFLGVKRSAEGKRFVNWFEKRLIDYCYDESFRGLFLDQKWADFIPVYFNGVKVINPAQSGVNVSVWNISQVRKIEEDNGKILIDGVAVKIYHWSGNEVEHKGVLSLLGKSASGLVILHKLHEKYRDKVISNDKENFLSKKLSHNYFDNGEKITGFHRQLYRMTPGVISKYSDPWKVIEGDCYISWFKKEINKKKISVADLPDNFDWRVYVYSNADLQKSGILDEKKAVEHFLKRGHAESRIYSIKGNPGSTLTREKIN